MVKFKPSIIRKLTLWFSVSLFVIFFVATGLLYFALSKILATDDNAMLQDRRESVSTTLKEETAFVHLKRRVNYDWASRRAELIFTKIVTADGRITLLSPDTPAEVDKGIFDVIPRGTLRGQRFEIPSGKIFLALSQPIVSADPILNGGTLYLALDLSGEKQILEKYKHVFLVILLAVVLLSILIGVRLARLSFSPVQDITDITKKIRSSSLHERIPETHLPVELYTLAKTINEMLDRLEDSFGRLSRFSADIAHELRTPLSNIRGQIDVARRQERSPSEYRDLEGSVLEEIERISKMIDTLLFLARTENPELQIKREPLNIREETLNICDFYAASADEDHIRFEVGIPAEFILLTDRTLFQRLLTNLISNALNYTDMNGFVKITAEHLSSNSVITVEDNGKGIAPEAIPHIFERFYRADPSRTMSKLGGFGLGLTIVQSIMRLHCGTVSVESEPGRGTKVTLSFPT